MPLEDGVGLGCRSSNLAAVLPYPGSLFPATGAFQRLLGRGERSGGPRNLMVSQELRGSHQRLSALDPL